MPTQFRDQYRKWDRVAKATMCIHHKPCDVIEVDRVGQTFPLMIRLPEKPHLRFCLWSFCHAAYMHINKNLCEFYLNYLQTIFCVDIYSYCNLINFISSSIISLIIFKHFLKDSSLYCFAYRDLYITALT